MAILALDIAGSVRPEGRIQPHRKALQHKSRDQIPQAAVRKQQIGRCRYDMKATDSLNVT